MKSMFSLLMLTLSVSSFAGGTGGNGGVSVVCRDLKGVITSAEILDLYEGREVFGRTYRNETLSSDTLMQLAQLKLVKHTEYLVNLQEEIAKAQANTTFIKNGNELEETNDALPLIRKKGCKFEQLANYTHDGNLLISQEIFDELSELNRAALYLHEAVYAIRRGEGDQDSQKTRRLVAHLMAANGDQKIIDSLVSYTITSGVYLNASVIDWRLNLKVENGQITVTEDTTNGRSFREFVLFDKQKSIYKSKYPYSGDKFIFLKIKGAKSISYSYGMEWLFSEENLWTTK